jgi:hypothetical protein
MPEGVKSHSATGLTDDFYMAVEESLFHWPMGKTWS